MPDRNPTVGQTRNAYILKLSHKRNKFVLHMCSMHIMQRWALQIEFQYSNTPIAIGLRNNNGYVGLTYRFRTSTTGTSNI
jgi:hypothetical protein